MMRTTIESLYVYWNGLRGLRPAPFRNEIDPAALARLLPDLFILEPADKDFRFRLAGTRLCGLFGYELRGLPFTEIWDDSVLDAINRMASRAMDRARPIRFEARGLSRLGRQVPLCGIVMPLCSNGGNGTVDRLIGAIVTPPALASRSLDPVDPLDLVAMDMAEATGLSSNGRGQRPSSAVEFLNRILAQGWFRRGRGDKAETSPRAKRAALLQPRAASAAGITNN